MKFLTKTQKEKIIKFLKDRENPDGGFGRQLRTVPVPQYTYYAIKSLKILQSMI